MTSTNRTEQEQAYIADAAMALHDHFARSKEARIHYLEQALKREPDKAHRKAITREYLDLTDPTPNQEPDL